jgi:hypothetical protein
MKLVPPQVDREELLDLNRGSMDEVRRSLRDVRRINTHLGGLRVVIDGTFDLLQRHHIRNATVLDIGTGSADIPLRLIDQARQRGIGLEVIGLDINPRHLLIARETIGVTKHIHLLQADAFHLPLPDNAVDITVSTLFLHHFRPPQIVQLLREFHRVSRIGWVMNDLVRHMVPLVFFRLTRPIFARSYITRHDGEASIRRGYTTQEMRRIVADCELPAIEVREHFPYRMSIVGDKSDG